MHSHTSAWVRFLYRADSAFARTVMFGLNFTRHFLYFALLRDRDLQTLTDLHYSSRPSYVSDDYNYRGLYPWETEALDRHFQGVRSILVTSCGGGRELLALAERGMEVVGTECHPGLCDAADRLCRSLGNVEVHCLPPPDLPPTSRPFDGVIIGWGGYTHLAPRAERTLLLRRVREVVRPGGPMLVSFLERRRGEDRSIDLACRLANPIRRVTLRRTLERGDTVAVGYGHRFLPGEAADEAREAGFEVLRQSPPLPGNTLGHYPHLVARRPEQPRQNNAPATDLPTGPKTGAS